MSRPMKNYLIGLFIAIVIYAVVVSWFVKRQIILPAELLDTIILFVLALATIFYAVRTSDIAKATKTQAEASVKIAEEMREARFAQVKPIVKIDWVPSSKLGETISPYFENIGLGPGLNIKCYCTHTKSGFKSTKQDSPALAVGKENRLHVTLKIEGVDSGDWAEFAVNCDYQSIYGKNFRSVLRFKTAQEKNLEILELK